MRRGDGWLAEMFARCSVPSEQEEHRRVRPYHVEDEDEAAPSGDHVDVAQAAESAKDVRAFGSMAVRNGGICT